MRHEQKKTGLWVLPRRLAASLVRLYQVTLSPLKRYLLGPNAGCRFYPTCSEYSRQAFLKHGFVCGLWLTLTRVFRCHPFHPGGHDPVPACCGRGATPKNSSMPERKWSRLRNNTQSL